MRNFTALKYDSLNALSKLKPPSGYELITYPFGNEKIVALEDPKTKWVYVVTPNDILPDCSISPMAVSQKRHIATIGIYEAWDVSLDILPLSKVVSQKCSFSRIRTPSQISIGTHPILTLSNPLSDIQRNLKSLLPKWEKFYQTNATVNRPPSPPKVRNAQQKKKIHWIIDHPPTATDQWILASILGLIFLAIFGRKA